MYRQETYTICLHRKNIALIHGSGCRNNCTSGLWFFWFLFHYSISSTGQELYIVLFFKFFMLCINISLVSNSTIGHGTSAIHIPRIRRWMEHRLINGWMSIHFYKITSHLFLVYVKSEMFEDIFYSQNQKEKKRKQNTWIPSSWIAKMSAKYLSLQMV